MYKPSRTHVIVNVLLRLPNTIKPIGINNQTIEACLFYAKLKWLNDVNFFLRSWQIEGTLFILKKQRLVKRAKLRTLRNGELYKMGHDNKMRKCLITIKAWMVIRKPYEGPSRGHFTI
jgi:hypothetical protein